MAAYEQQSKDINRFLKLVDIVARVVPEGASLYVSAPDPATGWKNAQLRMEYLRSTLYPTEPGMDALIEEYLADRWLPRYENYDSSSTVGGVAFAFLLSGFVQNAREAMTSVPAGLPGSIAKDFARRLLVEAAKPKNRDVFVRPSFVGELLGAMWEVIVGKRFVVRQIGPFAG